MGAVSFSLDQKLVAALQASLPILTFVETGTFKGDTLAHMVPFFDVLYSAELSTTLASEAAARFADEPKVKVVNRSSPDFLAEFRSGLADVPTLYWLDAHWCGAEAVAGQTSQCPLLSELSAIGSLHPSSTILIDDARLFLAPPAAPHEISQWPRFHELVTTLLRLSDRHEIMVVNDVIAFFPTRIRPQMEAYAQSTGVDWIAAAERVHMVLTDEKELVEKEGVIQNLTRALVEKEGALQEVTRSLVEKEGVIQDLKRALVEKEGAIQDLTRALVGWLKKRDPSKEVTRSLV